MDGCFSSCDESPDANCIQTDLDQLVASVPQYNPRFSSDQTLSVIAPHTLFAGPFAASRAAVPRSRGNRVLKPELDARRSRPHNLLRGSDQLEHYSLHVNPGPIGNATQLGHPSGNKNERSDQLTGSGDFIRPANSDADLVSSFHFTFDNGARGNPADNEPNFNGDGNAPPIIAGSRNLAQTQTKPHNSSSALTAADVVMKSYASVKIDSTLCRRLAGEVARRQPTQRRGDQKLNIERRSNVEAVLAHVTGIVAPQPCKNCRKGHGPWTECVVYGGQMCGSCANCWYNASGSRCTFHENNNPQPSQYPPPVATSSSIPAMNPPALAPAMPPHTNPMISIAEAAANEARLIASNAMGDIMALTKHQRYVARIQVAAEELGLRLAEYDDYIQTPEGTNEYQRELLLAQHGDISMDEGSQSDPSNPRDSI